MPSPTHDATPPERPPGEADDRIAHACRRLESAGPAPSITALAAEAGLSVSRFHHVFRERTGLTPKQFAAAHRDAHAREALLAEASVSDAVFAAGFTSSGRFYERADRMLGMTPTAWRRGGEGTTIRFAVGQASLGSVLVAHTSRGACAILLGDDPADLTQDLEARFPLADLRGDDEGFSRHVALVVGMVEHPARPVELPLDLQGTVFQQRVWRALCLIPPGTTATYTQIAQAIGSPRAARAVAAACAANPLAVAIPCHRVVRADGELAGYRWGIERKRALLDRESAADPSI